MTTQSGFCSTRPEYTMLSPGTKAKAWRPLCLRVLAILVILLLCNGGLSAYSVLTHMEIVDLLWTDGIRPLLLKRYPELSEDQVKGAHAYAYGGSVIQDLGYYPFGSVEFSDLVHYVRSGDFVRELLLESQDANEYAFALGALSHYASDIAGHPAVNRAVAIEYPELQAKYGKSVRFAADVTIGSYRFAVARLIPEMTQVALQTHKKDLMSETPSVAKQKFLYRLSRSDYEREWGKDYRKPGIGSRILAAPMHYLPKKGPFKAMAFNNPTPATEELYFKSINTTVDQYRAFLKEVRTDSLVLPNCDLDDGKGTKAAEYSLADDTYAKLLARLAKQKFDRTTTDLRDNILRFYSDLSVSIETKKDKVGWQSLLTALDQLKSVPPVRALAANPAK